jgi:hypothetical protein
MTSLETYYLAQFDTLQNSLDRAKEQKDNRDHLVLQLLNLSMQAKSFADWLKVQEKLG